MLKNGKPIPDGAIKCEEEADTITGHLPCWVKAESNNKAYKWAIKAFDDAGELEDGTYEICGEHFNSNRECLAGDIMIKHGSVEFEIADRNFEGIRKFLEENYIEGIVFHRDNGEMCKIRRKDYGLSW